MGPGADPESLVGYVVAGYQLIASIGTGASSWVYHGRRLADAPRSLEVTASDAIEFPDEAAIKLFIFIGGSSQERADNRKRFLAEAEALKTLTHPNIVRIISSGEDSSSGFTYMILPYMSGGNLAHLLAKSGPLPLERVSKILTQVAAALDTAHLEAPGVREGIIHRDVKPANILLDQAGNAYLADFSIARILSAASTLHTVSGRLMGTPVYMAPEQFGMTNKVGPRADIYALGMVVYEMVCGHVAFDGPDLPALMGQHLTQMPASPGDARTDLSEPAAGAILKALAKDPGQRFASAGEFAVAFAEGIQGVWSHGMGLTSNSFELSDDAKDPGNETTHANGQGPSGVLTHLRSARQKQIARRFIWAAVITVVVVALMTGTLLAQSDKSSSVMKTIMALFSPAPTATIVQTQETIAPSMPSPTDTTATATATKAPTATSRPPSQATTPPIIVVVTPQSQPATATPAPTLQVAYSAPSPGPCDNAGALWENEYATITCTSAGMHDAVDTTPSSSWYHGVAFYGNSQQFPEDYQLTVTVSNITAGTCTGFWYRGPYLAVICQVDAASPDHQQTKCYIQRFSGSGPVLQEVDGVTLNQTNTIRLTLIGPNQTFYLNGAQVLSVSDSFSLTTGSNIALTAYPPTGYTTPDLADFSDFDFTPLS